MPSCVIIVENLPVPLDRRVWQEATALRDAGWTVSVICPATEKYPKHFEIVEEIRIFRHSLPLEARGAMGFLLEYAAALFHESRLLLKVSRQVGFDVIQACNPPDVILFAALPWKLFGKKLVYDQHDVCPELLVVKFGDRRLLNIAASLAEKFSFKIADLVISANETFRQLAISRGGRRPEGVVTVYSVPDTRLFSRTRDIRSSSAREQVVLGYAGIINRQDGVENLVFIAKHLIGKHGIKNFRVVVVGDGPILPDVKALATRIGVSEYFTFTGYLSGNEFCDALSDFDIGIIPDPINALNDKISMNKVFEYAALGLPIVAFNLKETRRLLGEAATFAATDDAAGLADEVARLIGNSDLRRELGRRAKVLADSSFDWSNEARKYVAAVTTLVGNSGLGETSATS